MRPTREPLALPPEVAARLRVTEQTLANWRWRRTGPPWTKVGGRVRYDWDGVTAWERSQASEVA